MQMQVIITCSKSRALTYGLVGDKRLVVKAENLSHVVEIGMLRHKSPLCVVQFVIEISDRYLHSPIILVVKLHVPVHPYWTHMMSAL